MRILRAFIVPALVLMLIGYLTDLRAQIPTILRDGRFIASPAMLAESRLRMPDTWGMPKNRSAKRENSQTSRTSPTSANSARTKTLGLPGKDAKNCGVPGAPGQKTTQAFNGTNRNPLALPSRTGGLQTPSSTTGAFRPRPSSTLKLPSNRSTPSSVWEAPRTNGTAAASRTNSNTAAGTTTAITKPKLATRPAKSNTKLKLPMNSSAVRPVWEAPRTNSITRPNTRTYPRTTTTIPRSTTPRTTPNNSATTKEPEPKKSVLPTVTGNPIPATRTPSRTTRPTVPNART